MQRAGDMAALSETEFQQLLKQINKAREHSENAVVRRFTRRRMDPAQR